MDLGLCNKRVLVTGASKGIGFSIAKAFLAEGAKVFVVSRGLDQLNKTKDFFVKEFGQSQVFMEKCDCTDPRSIELLKKSIKKQWSGIDIVVANIGDGRSVPDAIPDDIQWKKTWDSNFESALHTARSFLPMLKDSKGSLLFISSIAAMEAFGAPVDYSTAKAAVVALSKNMARKLAKEVRVNVLAPGNIYFNEGSWDEKVKQDKDKVKEIIESTVPMNRFGLPEEVADAAVFICSERAKFITGSVIVVDGGQRVGVF
jgi:3-oxoacyl-[acyl-carrier protein] reductase